MYELTLWDYWRMLGPLGKLLFLYIAGILLSLLWRSIRCLLTSGLPHLRSLAPIFERSGISIALLTLTYGCVMGWLVCRGDFYGSEFEGTLNRALHQGVFHFKVLGCAFSTATLIFFIGWAMVPSARAKPRGGGV